MSDLSAAITHPLLMGVELCVDAKFSTRKGIAEWRHGPGALLSIVFFDKSDLDAFVTSWKAANQ